MMLQLNKHFYDLKRPLVMGILNITPDSFSDGGMYLDFNEALKRAEKMIEEGVDIIDIGGESTRPGSDPVSAVEELKRITPIIEAIKKISDIAISIDTYKPEVMKEVIDMDVAMINDIYALQKPNAIDLIKKSNVGVCLMHMQGTPKTMQLNPTYKNVVSEVRSFLEERANLIANEGIDKSRIILDPGFGFGKTFEHNIDLLKNIESFKSLNLPILVGLSRKSFIRKILNGDHDDHLSGSISAAILSVLKGAKILRVHDVKETQSAFKIIQLAQSMA
ncbi:dihydropteroate synthase [Candidatus Methylopumilus planktonicus]|uniref:dihydropteroate synthase n=1 Tax=Candidatus Methylopumilus planktonicus TaxID=1581557 RepID=UPI001123172B|nr:dihydropteroate synthase [Candidatus Methylopumilus planktonicus]QDD11154.1 dihydropteroate synthase [Candidatus Methylopumilus planktonicus]QDD23624.1 dihydropteroate synthase [Candidatus Methylopumilus planktonicus]